jgi:CrcB protein
MSTSGAVPGALHWDVLAVVAAGGALGSLGRWGLTLAFPRHGDRFPWATFLTNVSGAVLLGVLMVFVLEVWSPSRLVRPFLGVGVLGGYTTFSTAMLDARGLLADRHAQTALAYVALSVALGIAGVWLGMLAARAAVRAAGHGRRRP